MLGAATGAAQLGQRGGPQSGARTKRRFDGEGPCSPRPAGLAAPGLWTEAHAAYKAAFEASDPASSTERESRGARRRARPLRAQRCASTATRPSTWPGALSSARRFLPSSNRAIRGRTGARPSPFVATLYLSVDPPDAEVLVDGKRIGRPSADLQAVLRARPAHGAGPCTGPRGRLPDAGRAGSDRADHAVRSCQRAARERRQGRPRPRCPSPRARRPLRARRLPGSQRRGRRRCVSRGSPSRRPPCPRAAC